MSTSAPRCANAAAVSLIGDTALLRLLQLTSPALPLGAFAYSQGVEYAAHAGWVKDEMTALDWVRSLLEGPLCHLDLPMLVRMHAAWLDHDEARVRELSTALLAHRESAELEQEDLHLGHSLARVLAGHGFEVAQPWIRGEDATFAALHALAAATWAIPVRSALFGYAFAWSESQAGALSRVLPLGQLAIQRILSALIEALPAAIDVAMTVPDDELGALAPSHAMA
ncbi:MAG TPA: urease accessory UreF family protein, partial [Polyangiaceae bacterium]|nr:urease accessory UreF family protein [Polyangiaceae bacterium]